MKFNLLHKDSSASARAGTLSTDHGNIETPIFMPVGTAATVKGVHQRELKQDIKPDIILGNTYHLYLRPGTEILKQAMPGCESFDAIEENKFEAKLTAKVGPVKAKFKFQVELSEINQKRCNNSPNPHFNRRSRLNFPPRLHLWF